MTLREAITARHPRKAEALFAFYSTGYKSGQEFGGYLAWNDYADGLVPVENAFHLAETFGLPSKADLEGPFVSAYEDDEEEPYEEDAAERAEREDLEAESFGLDPWWNYR